MAVDALKERILEVVSVEGMYLYAEQLLAGYAARFAKRQQHAAPATPAGHFTHAFQCAYGRGLTQCSLEIL